MEFQTFSFLFISFSLSPAPVRCMSSSRKRELPVTDVPSADGRISSRLRRRTASLAVPGCGATHSQIPTSSSSLEDDVRYARYASFLRSLAFRRCVSAAFACFFVSLRNDIGERAARSFWSSCRYLQRACRSSAGVPRSSTSTVARADRSGTC